MTTEGIFSASQNDRAIRRGGSSVRKLPINLSSREAEIGPECRAVSFPHSALIALAILLLSSMLAATLRAQSNVGIGTTTPDATSILELSSTNSGLLVPRMTTIQRNAIATPARGLLVFDLTSNGFWYFDGAVWLPIAGGWLLAGNSGTVDGTNFLGTTDNVAFTIRVNNQRALRIEPNGSSPNLIGGYSGNFVSSGAVGSVVAGGGDNGSVNSALTDFDFVGGGVNNVAGSAAPGQGENRFDVVAGGWNNTSSGFSSSILGGANNIAAGTYASTLGGLGGIANGCNQSVVGVYNDPIPATPGNCDLTNPAFIVGGGFTDFNRYNSLTVDFQGLLTLGELGLNNSFGATPTLRITGATSGFVGFRAAASTTSHTYVMPAQQGAASTVLTNDGSGNLSWASRASTQRLLVTTLSAFAASTNNLPLDTTKSVFRISASTAINLTGLADTSDGRMIILTNVGSNTITVTDQDANSTAAFRIITGSAASLALTQDRSITLYYDGTTSRWRVTSRTP